MLKIHVKGQVWMRQQQACLTASISVPCPVIIPDDVSRRTFNTCIWGLTLHQHESAGLVHSTIAMKAMVLQASLCR